MEFLKNFKRLFEYFRIFSSRISFLIFFRYRNSRRSLKCNLSSVIIQKHWSIGALRLFCSENSVKSRKIPSIETFCSQVWYLSYCMQQQWRKFKEKYYVNICFSWAFNVDRRKKWTFIFWTRFCKTFSFFMVLPFTGAQRYVVSEP